jgi:hypothetical protein
VADLIDGYLAELRGELRCRRWRKDVILAEANDHLRETVAELQGEGLAEADAERAAVQRFGHAVVVGRRFSPWAEAWTALAWYLHLGVLAGLAVFSYGTVWLLVIIENWTLDGDPFLSPPGTGVEDLAAFQAMLLGLVVAGVHAALRVLLFESRDVAFVSRLLLRDSGRGLAFLGLVAMVWTVGTFAVEWDFSESAVRSIQFEPGLALLILGAMLRYLPLSLRPIQRSGS